MIKANPATFIAIVVAIAFVEWVILHFWYRGRLSRERARVYEHHELTIVVETGSDCRTYAAGFEATLKEAGWDVHNWTIENPPRRPTTGIAVQVPDLNNISKEAELLRTALVAAYVDIELMHMEDFPVRTSIQLLITASAS